MSFGEFRSAVLDGTLMAGEGDGGEEEEEEENDRTPRPEKITMNLHDECARFYFLRIADARQRYLRLDGSGCLALMRRRARANRFCEHLPRDLSAQLAPFHGSIELEVAHVP